MGKSADGIALIGGGLAGLSAAAGLVDRGLEVKLFEKEPFLGGRASSFSWNGKKVDIGQHLHAAAFNNYLEFLKKIGLGDEIWTQGRLEAPLINRERVKGTLKAGYLSAPIHLFSSFLTYPFLGFRDKISCVRPYLEALSGERSSAEGKTFADWLSSKGVTQNALEKIWNPPILATLNAPTSKVDASMGLMIVKRVLMDKEEGRLGALRAPLSDIGRGAAEYIEDKGGEVFTSTGVESLEAKEGGGFGLKLESGKKIEAGCCISALPVPELEEILSNGMEEKVSLGSSGFDWDPIVNVNLFYPESPFEEFFLGTVDTDIQWLFDAGKIRGGEEGHLTISISHAREEIEEDPERLARRMDETLRGLFPKALGETQLEDFLVVKQKRATFRPSPGIQDRRPGTETSLPGFFLAGDWTDTGWPSTMEGAVRSGLNACEAAEGYLRD